MYATIAFLALTANVSPGTVSPAAAWQPNYSAARLQGSVSNKPLAVFINSGADGWKSVVRDSVDPKVTKLLSEKFVCLYVDANSAEGKVLSSHFQVGRGVVISDRVGTTQVYSRSGDISGAELNSALEKYSDGTTTESTETVLIAFGGKCSSGGCSSGTCSTGTCGTTHVAHAETAACAPVATCPTTECHAAPSSCGHKKCGLFGGGLCGKGKSCGSSMPSCGTSSCGSASSCGTSSCGSSRKSCFGGFKLCGGGMKGGCSSGGCH